MDVDRLAQQPSSRCPPLPLKGIEYRFGLLLAAFGLVFLFSLPPIQAPDENVHLLHAYDVAKGHLLAAHDSEGWAATTVPPAFVSIIEQSARFWRHPEDRWTWQDFRDLLDLRFRGEERLASMLQASTYSFVPYLPQAAGIRLAQELHLSPLWLFYMGRLGNLVFGIFCVVLAVRLTPVGKLLFGAVALMPLTVQQFASLSADGPTIGLTLILVAALLRFALSSASMQIPNWAVGGLLLLIFAIPLTKFPYTLLALLYFGATPQQIGSRRRYWLIGFLVLAVTAAGLVTSALLTRPYIPDPHRLCDVPISPSGQARFVLTHPQKLLKAFFLSATVYGIGWFLSLFTLGCLDTPLNPLAGFAYLAFLALLAVADRRPSELPWRLWGIGSTIALSNIVAILTALYVWWTPPANNLIEGTQGRYFIPLMPLLFLLLRNSGIRVTADERFLARMTLAVLVIFLSYAWATLMNRYYFREPSMWLSPSLLLGLSSVALLLWWARCRWDLASIPSPLVGKS